MEIEQEKLFEDRRHTINVEQFSPEDSEEANDIEVVEEGTRVMKPKEGWTEVLKRNEDNIGRGLVISLFFSIALLLVLLIWWT